MIFLGKRREEAHRQQSKREVCHLTEVRIKNFTIKSAKIVKRFCSDVCLLMFFVCLFFSRKHRKKEREGRNGTERQIDRQKEREREAER